LEELIPLPPIQEQERIVAHLNRIKETVDSLKKLQQETDLEKLVPSILNKAFKGSFNCSNNPQRPKFLTSFTAYSEMLSLKDWFTKTSMSSEK
jgi:hypothetical protein